MIAGFNVLDCQKNHNKRLYERCFLLENRIVFLLVLSLSSQVIMVEFRKGKVSRVFHSKSYLPQSLTRIGGEQSRSSTWPTNILAPCVSSHFPVPAYLPGICGLTLGRSRTSVRNAKNHSVWLEI